MTCQDMTDWFPPHIKPVHVGYYERKYPYPLDDGVLDYWDGRRWKFCDSYGRQMFASTAPRKWRGLRRPQA